MTNKSRKDAGALDRLTEFLVEDILNAQDSEILAEAKDDDRDPERVVQNMRALYEKAVLESAKAKLIAAKKAAAEYRNSASDDIVDLHSEKLKRRYETMIESDPALSKKLTMAARKGEGQSERDIQTAIKDLAELGLFDDEDSDT